jgi:hypothetical protein
MSPEDRWSVYVFATDGCWTEWNAYYTWQEAACVARSQKAWLESQGLLPWVLVWDNTMPFEALASKVFPNAETA